MDTNVIAEGRKAIYFGRYGEHHIENFLAAK